MAQIRNDLNKIAEGINETTHEAINFGNERRSEAINNLNEDNQARMKKLAEEAVRMNNIDAVKLVFQEIINKYTNLLAQNDQTPEKNTYERIIANNKASLLAFNQEVEKLLQGKSNDKTSEQLTEEQFAKELTMITDKIYAKEKNLIFNFIAEPNEYYQELEDYINKATSISKDKKNLIKSALLNKNAERLMKYFGTEPYKFYAVYCNNLNAKIEKLSHEYAGTEAFNIAYNDLLKFIDGMKKNSNNSNIKVSFDEETQILSISFPQNIIKKVEKPIISQKVLNYLKPNSMSENEKKESETVAFTEQCESLINVYFQEYENTINTLKDTLDRNMLDKQLDILVEDKGQFSHLTKDEKIKIINEIGRRYDNEKIDKYGEGFVDYLRNTIISNLSEIPFDKLYAAEYGTKEFEQYYDEVYAGLEKLRNAVYKDQMSYKFIKDMSYDDITQKFTIEFANKIVPKYEKQIMSNQAIAALNDKQSNSYTNINIEDIGNEVLAEDTSNEFPDFFDSDFTEDLALMPTDQEGINTFSEEKTTQENVQTSSEINPTSTNISPQPSSFVTPVETSRNIDNKDNIDRDTFVRNYLIKVQELNNTIALLNNINKKLEASLIHDFLNPVMLENAVNLEKEADELDQKVIASKLELTKERIEFKNKYNEYILAIPEVKNAQLSEIKFTNNNLTAFVTLVDEQLATAENQVIKLDKERQKALTDEEKASIDKQINAIITFVESQNSLIARRIVIESANKDFDIVEFLQNRREKKKEIREKIKQAYESTNVLSKIKPEEEKTVSSVENNIPSDSPEITPLAAEHDIPSITPIVIEPINELQTPEETPAYFDEVPVEDETMTESAEPSVTQEEQPVKPNYKNIVYADDDPMKYNKIPELPEEEFDKVFELFDDGSYDELTEMDDNYLKELGEQTISDFGIEKNSGENNDYTAPVIPEDNTENETAELQNIVSNIDQIVEEPIIEEPIIEEQIADEPIIEEPIAEEPIAEEPIAEEQIADEPFDMGLALDPDIDYSKFTFGDIANMMGEINGDSDSQLDIEEVFDDKENSTSDEINFDIEDMIPLAEIDSFISEPTSEPSKENEVASPENSELKKYQSITARKVNNDLVKTLGLTIIDWNENKGTIIKNDFRDFYLSESKISEKDYDEALAVLRELNVIDIEKYRILPKMSKDKFNEVISEYNQAMEQEKIPQQVTIELKILETNPLITTQKVDRDKGLICSGDIVTISMISKGIKVKYSEELRTKLSDLNAKLRLIKKDNLHVRATSDINDNEQEVKFKDGRDVNHEEYKVDIRVPGVDKPILEYDLAEQDEEEKSHTL